MSLERDWDSIRPDHTRAMEAGMGLLRLTLLFGSAAVALALLAAPFLDNQVRPQFARSGFVGGLDTMSTGSIGRSDTYTIRRSVLQPSPASVCLIRSDGRRSGDC